MRISISRWVGAGLLALLGLAGVLIAVNGRAVTRYRTNTVLLSQHVLPIVQVTGELHDHANGITTESLNYIITGDEVYLEHRAENIVDARNMLAELQELQLDNISGEQDERDRTKLLSDTIESTIALTNDLVEQRRGNQPLDFALLAGQIHEVHERIEAAVESFLETLDDERQVALAGLESDPRLPGRIIGVLLLLCGIAFFLMLRRFVLRPLGVLRDTALAVAAGDLGRQVPLNSNDELGDVGRALNTMIGRVAAQQRSLQERAATLEAANIAQAQLLDTVRALDVPIIPVGAGVLALPLIGAVDAARAAQLTRRLLDAVQRERARVVILDVTGLAMVDRTTATYLSSITEGVGLLGAEVILTGVRADLARSLSQSEIDLKRLNVRATLQDGISAAFAAQQDVARPA